MVVEIWQSFRRTPLWVQIWVVAILIPANILPIAFLGHPGAALITVLSIGGMLPNLVIMALDRGVSRAMSIPHLFLWIPLVVILVHQLATVELAAGYAAFLAVLLVIDLISLAFDIPDSLRWLRGDRGIA